MPSLDEHLGDNLNLYAYAGNNPIRRIDLTGFWGEELIARIKNLAQGVAQGAAEASVPGGMVVAAATPRTANGDVALGRAAAHAIGGAVSIAVGVQRLVTCLGFSDQELLGSRAAALRRARPWAKLLKRTFGFDVLACPRCDGRMRLLAMLSEPKSVTRYLRGLGESTDESTDAPARAPARGPPFWESWVLRRAASDDHAAE